MSQPSIEQRAQHLQSLLGRSGHRPAPPAQPSLKGQPFTLASPAEWTKAWAETEAAVLQVTVEAFRKWTTMWTLAPLAVNGSIVSGPPGCVMGPPPMVNVAMLTSALVPQRPEARQYCLTAAGLIDAWLMRVRESLSVMALPWYPTFAHHPGPMAPPTPCMNAWLKDMARTSKAHLIPNLLADDLYRKATTPNWSRHFGDNMGDLGRIVSDRIASDLVKYLENVFALASVQGVMATGPVMGYAPPAATMGTVVGQTLPHINFLRGVEGAVSPLLLRA